MPGNLAKRVLSARPINAPPSSPRPAHTPDGSGYPGEGFALRRCAGVRAYGGAGAQDGWKAGVQNAYRFFGQFWKRYFNALFKFSNEGAGNIPGAKTCSFCFAQRNGYFKNMFSGCEIIDGNIHGIGSGTGAPIGAT